MQEHTFCTMKRMNVNQAFDKNFGIDYAGFNSI